MIGIFKKMIAVATDVGSILKLNMYEDFARVEGKTSDGKVFTLSLVVKEEEKDA